MLSVKEHFALPLVLTLLPAPLPLNQAEHLQLEVVVCGVPPSKAMSDAFYRAEAQSWSQEIPASPSHDRWHHCA